MEAQAAQAPAGPLKFSPPSKRTRVVTQPYTQNNACSKCRKAKARCEGFPICKRCIRLEHECIRGPDHRKVLTRHHEQNLRHQNEQLRAHVEEMAKKMDALTAELSLLRSQSGTQAASSPSLVQVEPELLIRTPRENEARLLSGTQAITSEFDGEPQPCSESDSETDSESDEKESETEMINVDGRRNLFAIREFGQIHEHVLISPFRSLRRRTRSKRTLKFMRRREESPALTERHVLLLPGLPEEEIEIHCKCDGPCWARFLPQNIPLTRAAHDLSWCLRIIPEYFLRDMHRYLHAPSTSPLPRTVHYSPFLHLTILSVATAFSDDPVLASKDVRKLFADLAKMRLEDELGTPSLSAVQGLSMLGSYHSGLGEQTLGFVYFGMSARLSQALGLGADCAKWVQKGRMTSRDLFDRYWTFHMECAQDACWALYVGREFGIPVGHNDPYALAELADPTLDYMSWRTLGGEPQACLTFTTFLYSCGLMKISRQIMSVMSIISTADNGNELKIVIADIDDQLISWKEDLPDALKLNTSSKGNRAAPPHVLMMHCALWWLVILLHRPFYRRRKSSGLDNSFNVSRCNLAAREILTLIRIWRTLYGTVRFASITLVQVIFAAGTVHLLAAHQALATCAARPATTAHAKALKNVEEAIVALDELGQSWPHAGNIADTFRKLGDASKQRMEARMQVKPGREAGKGSGSQRQENGFTESRLETTSLFAPVPNSHAAIPESTQHAASHPLSMEPFALSSSLRSQAYSEDVALQHNLAIPALPDPSRELDMSFFDDVLMDGGSSILDLSESDWGMVDGGSFPDQPFAVELGGSASSSFLAAPASGMPADWSGFESLDLSADTNDPGLKALYEMIVMGFV